jgi:hypothetical protein
MTRWFVLALVTLALCVSAPALAEVCDKIDPNWKPGDLPTTHFKMPGAPFLTASVVVGVAILAACIALRWVGKSPLWLGVILGLPFVGFAYIRHLEESDFDFWYVVYSGGVREGCVFPFNAYMEHAWVSLIPIFLVSLAAILFVRLPKKSLT